MSFTILRRACRWSLVLCLFLVIAIISVWRIRYTSAVQIALDGTVRHQTMQSWEATAFAAQEYMNAYNPAFNAFKDELFDRLVGELGINRVRLEIPSGAENPRDSWSEWFIDGQISQGEWLSHRYEILNDNGDAGLVDPSGFTFSEVDWTIQNVVLPVKQRVESNGERFYLNLTYVDFGASAFEHANRPSEYAEFMSAAFHHMDREYGFVPDSIEVVLEPDNADWSGTQIGQAIVAAGDRLQSEGFSPDFVAPSSSTIGHAISAFDEMVGVPRVTEYLSEFAYHRYGSGPDRDNPRLAEIADRAEQHGIRSSMLERLRATHEALHIDLKRANVSAWARYAMAAEARASGRSTYYLIDQRDDPENPSIRLDPDARYMPQYMRYVREGAVRIEAASDDGDFDPVAFTAEDGRYVAIVKADQAGDIEIDGLPQGLYGITYTSPTEFLQELPSMQIATGQTLVASIPASGVITVYGMGIPGVGIPGDFDRDGNVDQADLDLILLNWGQDASTPPDGWISDLPSGTIDQDELDRILLHWGDRVLQASAVPEPTSVSLGLIAACLFAASWFFRCGRPRATVHFHCACRID